MLASRLGISSPDSIDSCITPLTRDLVVRIFAVCLASFFGVFTICLLTTVASHCCGDMRTTESPVTVQYLNCPLLGAATNL